MVRQWISAALLLTHTDGARIQKHIESAADAKTSCQDTDRGLSNTFGNGCSKYGSDFGDTACGYFDTADFKSAVMCCACGGGTGVCQDTDHGITNTFGNGCSKYGSDFSDTSCGFFDTDDFKSAEMCCACGGGRSSSAGHPAPPPRRMICVDSDHGRTNTFGNGCSKYGSGFSDTSCGYFDDGDFKSDEMCCSCGGGSRGPEAFCEDHTCGVGFMQIHAGNYGCGATSCSAEQCCVGANRIQARITDATNMLAISNAEVVIRQGELLIRRTTNNNGEFDAEGVPQGVITLSVSKEGFIGAEKTITVVGSISGAVADISMSPVLPRDGWRAVLTWGRTPVDLDSHTYFDACHVSYSNRHATCSGVSANLDVDQTHGYGPETTTLAHVNSRKIVFKVHNYSGSPGWSGSDAVVRLYNGEREVGTYHVNSHGIQNGVNWSVFQIDGSTGHVTVCSTAACT